MLTEKKKKNQKLPLKAFEQLLVFGIIIVKWLGACRGALKSLSASIAAFRSQNRDELVSPSPRHTVHECYATLWPISASHFSWQFLVAYISTILKPLLSDCVHSSPSSYFVNAAHTPRNGMFSFLFCILITHPLLQAGEVWVEDTSVQLPIALYSLSHFWVFLLGL